MSQRPGCHPAERSAPSTGSVKRDVGPPWPGGEKGLEGERSECICPSFVEGRDIGVADAVMNT
jgi:hypothetical protein